MEDAARIALGCAIDFLASHPWVSLIRFVLMGAEALDTWRRVLEELAPTQRLKSL